MHYTYYDRATGEIRGGIEAHDVAVDDSWAGEGGGVVASADQLHGDDPARHYVTGSPAAVAPRPAMGCSVDKLTFVANGIDKATISGIPVGAEVVVQDINGRSRYVVTDGVLELLAARAQSIGVQVVLFPYRDHRVTVRAT